jgi:hypothetical protein
MTTSVTDDQVRAAFEEWKVRCGLTKKSNSLDSYKSSFSEGYKAALRSQGKVVNLGDLLALREEVRVQASLKDHYADWEETERMFTAIIGEGD